jgi:acyl-coenzyme A thioesterase PaaI-like protein
MMQRGAGAGAPPEVTMLLKETALVRLLGLRIPVLLFVSPSVVELDDEGCAVRIPLGWRTRNHLGSMYFGALCAGADLAGGLNAFRLIRTAHPDVKLVFADVKGEFLKRADGDVLFRCRDGRRVAEAMRQTEATGERVTLPVEIVCTVPKKYGDEPVARFTLGLSLKKKSAEPAAANAPPARRVAGG